MGKSALQLAMEQLEPDEREAVRKLWRVQKQIEQEAREFRRRHIIRV